MNDLLVIFCFNDRYVLGHILVLYNNQADIVSIDGYNRKRFSDYSFFVLFSFGTRTLLRKTRSEQNKKTTTFDWRMEDIVDKARSAHTYTIVYMANVIHGTVLVERMITETTNHS